MKKNNIFLNFVFLKNKVTELQIKQWWLAEQIGVDRKTVIRWLNGQVKSIQIENAEKLAEILNCEISDLEVQNEANQFATIEDQKIAAQDILSSSLIEKLGNIGEWNIIESLLKATVIPNLPLNVLGELYDKLTIASWRQSKIEQATAYNLKTEDIARKTNDKTLLASALLSKANIYSWNGKSLKSTETYLECLKFEKNITPQTLGAIYSNLGAVLYESGDYSQGENYIRKSIEIFKEFGKPVNLSITHCHLAIMFIVTRNFLAAKNETLQSIHYAKLDDYKRGLAQGKMLLAQIEAHDGNFANAVKLINESLSDFLKLNIEESFTYEQAARAYRFLSEYKKAEESLLSGFKYSKNFPIYEAGLFLEYAEILKIQNNSKWKEKAEQAIKLYENCECFMKVNEIRKHFSI